MWNNRRGRRTRLQVGEYGPETPKGRVDCDGLRRRATRRIGASIADRTAPGAARADPAQASLSVWNPDVNGETALGEDLFTVSASAQAEGKEPSGSPMTNAFQFTRATTSEGRGLYDVRSWRATGRRTASGSSSLCTSSHGRRAIVRSSSSTSGVGSRNLLRSSGCTATGMRDALYPRIRSRTVPAASRQFDRSKTSWPKGSRGNRREIGNGGGLNSGAIMREADAIGNRCVLTGVAWPSRGLRTGTLRCPRDRIRLKRGGVKERWQWLNSARDGPESVDPSTNGRWTTARAPRRRGGSS